MEWDPGQSSDSGEAWTDLPAGFGVSPEEPEVTGHCRPLLGQGHPREYSEINETSIKTEVYFNGIGQKAHVPVIYIPMVI